MPSLILGLPAFVIGIALCLALHATVAATFETAAGFFVLAVVWAALYYHAMPYERIRQELQRLRQQDHADRERMFAYEHRRSELAGVVDRMKRSEAERTHLQQQIANHKEMEEAARIQRLRALLGYQRADPWGGVAIVLSCFALVLAVLGLFTCVTYVVALPFAVIGLVSAFLSTSERRQVALTLSLVTLLPVLLVAVLLILGVIGATR